MIVVVLKIVALLKKWHVVIAVAVNVAFTKKVVALALDFKHRADAAAKTAKGVRLSLAYSVVLALSQLKFLVKLTPTVLVVQPPVAASPFPCCFCCHQSLHFLCLPLNPKQI